MGLADILFLRKTESGLIKLEEIVELEEKTESKNEHIKYDVEFHSMLYEISQNETIQRFQKMLMPIFDYMNTELNVKSQILNEEYASHRVLLNVLKNGTPEEFRSKMKNHLFNYFEKV
jgi:DNA-binding FadR family transcriptional regulator